MLNVLHKVMIMGNSSRIFVPFINLICLGWVTNELPNEADFLWMHNSKACIFQMETVDPTYMHFPFENVCLIVANW